MAGTTSQELQAGRAAAARYAWRDAFDSLQRVDAAEELSPQDLEALGEAAWWTGNLEACISAREKAYGSYLRSGDNRRAAMVAMAVAKDHFAKGSATVGRAWVGRAERLLEREDEGVEHGYLARLSAVMAFEGGHDYDAALQEAEKAYVIAERFADRDLLAMAIQDRGRVLVAMGRVEEGWRLMDEATVAAVSGDLSPYTTGVVYCNTITACKELSDYQRAGEWTEAAKRWCERQSIAGFPGMCRVYRAGVMLVAGHWSDAENEARDACRELENFNLSYQAEAFYELGEVRLHIGDIGGAQDAFERAHQLGREPQPGLAVLRMRQRDADAAWAGIRRALEDAPTPLERARLLPTYVEIALQVGSVDDAAAATDELSEIADRYGSTALQAAATTARGHVELARGEQTALRTIRRARRLWEDAGAPYEAARSRVLLAHAYLREGDEDAAHLEARGAAAVFDRLGATDDLRALAEAFRDDELIGGALLPTARERRTFLFTDIVGSTQLVEAIGDDAWQHLVHWHDRTLRTLFSEHSGEEIDHAGDGFFVAFHDPTSAIRCATAIQRKLREHRKQHGFSVNVRAGLHATEATKVAGGYKGKGVHQAARIASLAGSGEILASRSTLPERGSYVTSPPRELTLKGIAEPVEVVAIDWD